MSSKTFTAMKKKIIVLCCVCLLNSVLSYPLDSSDDTPAVNIAPARPLHEDKPQTIKLPNNQNHTIMLVQNEPNLTTVATPIDHVPAASSKDVAVVEPPIADEVVIIDQNGAVIDTVPIVEKVVVLDNGPVPYFQPPVVAVPRNAVAPPRHRRATISFPLQLPL